MTDEQTLEIAGRPITLTSPEKVFFPERGDTKLDLLRYYLEVVEPFLRTSGGRPTLMQRFPHGADGASFFQKRVPKSAPEWLQTTIVTTPNGTTSRALVLADMAHVAWAVNLACLGFHVWPNLYDRPEVADELRLDLDPQPGVGFEEVRAAATEVHALLDELGVRRRRETGASTSMSGSSRAGTPTKYARQRSRRHVSSSAAGPS
jgi:DNA primase